MTIPGSAAHRRRQRAQLLRFAAGSTTPEGFGSLDDRGVVQASAPTELYVTCRMTHVFSLGLLAGEPAVPGGPGPDRLRELATHGIDRLLDGPLHDRQYGGWLNAVRGAEPVDASKQAYAHAFVVLAASSAVTAGIERAEQLLDLALQVQLEHFWDDAEGMVVEEWDRGWQQLDTYRGLNSTMHTVEAYSAAGAATGATQWYDRAARMATRAGQWAASNSWRLPEHFDQQWRPLLEHHRDRPADQFRPYGATIGHGLEWARLMVTLNTALGGTTPELDESAVNLADRAVRDGWAVDGQDGFVYTTDWHGEPVVRARLHWVLAEAIAASTVLHWSTGRAGYAQDAERWWRYADRYLIDPDGYSWRHELTPENTPGSGTWAGRPDVYHAYQAALTADTLGAPSFAAGVARWVR